MIGPDDVRAELASLGKGLVQLNLKLSRALEGMELSNGGDDSPRRGAEPVLPAEATGTFEVACDLIDALDGAIACAAAGSPEENGPPAGAPKKLRRLWRRWLPRAGASREQLRRGLVLARDHAMTRLRSLGYESVAVVGPQDPALHQVVDTTAAPDPSLEGHLAHTHRRGWVRVAGDRRRVLRHALVTVYTIQRTNPWFPAESVSPAQPGRPRQHEQPRQPEQPAPPWPTAAFDHPSTDRDATRHGEPGDS